MKGLPVVRARDTIHVRLPLLVLASHGIYFLCLFFDMSELEVRIFDGVGISWSNSEISFFKKDFL